MTFKACQRRTIIPQPCSVCMRMCICVCVYSSAPSVNTVCARMRVASCLCVCLPWVQGGHSKSLRRHERRVGNRGGAGGRGQGQGRQGESEGHQRPSTLSHGRLTVGACLRAQGCAARLSGTEGCCGLQASCTSPLRAPACRRAGAAQACTRVHACTGVR